MPSADRVGIIILVVVSTAAFCWIVSPFVSPVLWAVVATALFAPLDRLFLRWMPGRRNLAAALTVLAVVFALILPSLGLAAALVGEAASLLANGQHPLLEIGPAVARFHAALPNWLRDLFVMGGIANAQDLQASVAATVSGALSNLVAHAAGIGQSAFGLAISLGVMIYLTFFFIRDGAAILAVVRARLPLPRSVGDRLFGELRIVLRATLRGTLIVAVAQGAVGGAIFWALGIEAPLLWALAMAFMSLLPPFGAGVVWVPVAAFLLLSGAIWQGATLIFCGLFIIGLVDNVLRPILVGHDARIPNYLVFLSTLGGLSLLGLDGIIVGPMIVAVLLVSWATAQPQNDRLIINSD